MATITGECTLNGSVTSSFAASVITEYTYSIASDTANGAVASVELSNEIAASSITVAVDHIETAGDVLDVHMKDTLSAGNKTTLDGIITAHDGVEDEAAPDPVNISNLSVTSENVLKMEQGPREGDALNFYSPNMCDQTTWYEGCTEVEDFELTDSGDLTTWNTNGTHPGPWVDLYHGKLFSEATIIAANPNCEFEVEIQEGGTGSWIAKTMNTFDDTDGDYGVDFVNGTITFNSALTSGDKVRACFCKSPSTMTWTMAPSAGKRLKLMYAEVQFTADMELEDDIIYETWAYNPYDLPNKIKVNEIIYKSLSDFMYESTGSYPVIPGFGGTGPRGLGNKDIVVLPYNYSTFRDMRSSQGIEVRIKTNTEHTGTMGTSTLYCLQEDE